MLEKGHEDLIKQINELKSENKKLKNRITELEYEVGNQVFNQTNKAIKN